ncbi:MAG: hypothetical protein HY319_01700 [Armatimonadetes bacterium]|nr:hypothetical protein [Armatimonadota bacterium]
MRKSSRAASLGVALVVITLALLAAFTLGGSSLLAIGSSHRLEKAAVARGLAESAISQAMADLVVQLENQTGVFPSVELSGLEGLPPGAVGLVGFDRSWAAARQIPPSTSNLDGTTPEGWGRVVPEGYVHLVGTGRCAGVTEQVEALIHFPEFPRAIACSGPVELQNTLVGSVRDPESLRSDGRLQLDPEDVEPADLASNSRSGSAVEMDAGTLVAGDVQAKGDIDVNGAVVQGEVRARWPDEVPLPRFEVRSYDPEVHPEWFYVTLPGDRVETQELTGINRSRAGLTVDGDLTLHNAILYVDGALEVTGAIRGRGAVFVAGAAEVGAGAELTGGEGLALAAEGNVTLTGENRERSFFEGLVYTEGRFEARDLTLVGSFTAHNPENPEKAAVELQDANVIHTARGARIDVDLEKTFVIDHYGRPVNKPPSSIRTRPSDNGPEDVFLIRRQVVKIEGVEQVEYVYTKSGIYNFIQPPSWPLDAKVPADLLKLEKGIRYETKHHVAPEDTRFWREGEREACLASKRYASFELMMDSLPRTLSDQAGQDWREDLEWDRGDDVAELAASTIAGNLAETFEAGGLDPANEKDFHFLWPVDPNQFIALADRLRIALWQEL